MGEQKLRFLLRGLIDGSLSNLGVVIGAYGSAITAVIVAAGLAGGVSNGLSNIFGAYVGERAIVHHELTRAEEAILKKGRLRGTALQVEGEKRAVHASFVDGLSTIAGAMIPLLPFFFFPLVYAFKLAIGTTVGLLFVLGLYLGKIAKERILLAAIKMATFGIITAIACYFIEQLIML